MRRTKRARIFQHLIDHHGAIDNRGRWGKIVSAQYRLVLIQAQRQSKTRLIHIPISERIDENEYGFVAVISRYY